MLKTVFSFLVLLAFVLFSFSCSTQDALLNPAPIVDAGKDAKAITSYAYRLSGATAKDGNKSGSGEIAKVVWHITSAPKGSSYILDKDFKANPTNSNIANGNSLSNAYFTPDVDGKYTVVLTAYDNGKSNNGKPGVSKKTKNSLVINASAAYGLENPSPSANAGDDLTASSYTFINISTATATDNNFTHYTDFDENTGFTETNHGAVNVINWIFSSVPSGSALNSTNIKNANTLSPSFLADKAGEYELKLIVADNGLDNLGNIAGVKTDEDSITITVSDPDEKKNAAPYVYAGDDEDDAYVNITYTIITAFAGDNPAGGGTLDSTEGMVWTFDSVPSGTSLEDTSIANSTTIAPSFTPDVKGDYILKLSVKDNGKNGDGSSGTVASASDTITITVSDTDPNENIKPNADAGDDSTWTSGIEYDHSNASASADDSDSNYGAVNSILWTFYSKPEDSTLEDSDISKADKTNPKFTADKTGLYILKMLVTDNGLNEDNSSGTVKTAEDYVTITILDSYNPSPSIDAGSDEAGIIATEYDHSGASTKASADDEPLGGGAVASAGWTLIFTPSDSAKTTADITQDGTTKKPSFKFTADKAGTYIFQLKVTDNGKNLDGSDGTAKSSYDTVSLIIEDGATNPAPIANAGNDKSGEVGDTITTDDASGVSTDSHANGAIASYAWIFESKPTGSGLTDGDITNAATNLANFDPDVGGTYVLKLTVTDNGNNIDGSAGTAATDTDTISIVIDGNPAPSANAGGNQPGVKDTEYDHSSAGATATDTNDGASTGGIATVIWTFKIKPIDSSLTDSDIISSGADLENPSFKFTPDVSGDFTLMLTILDNGKNKDGSSGNTRSDSDTVKITVP